MIAVCRASYWMLGITENDDEWFTDLTDVIAGEKGEIRDQGKILGLGKVGRVLKGQGQAGLKVVPGTESRHERLIEHRLLETTTSRNFSEKP